MATRVNNNKKFLIIKLTPEEALNKCYFGYSCELICDDCNKDITNDKFVYYVPVLNRCLCEKCYDDWYSHATRYEEDIDYEIDYYNMYADVLGLEMVRR